MKSNATCGIACFLVRKRLATSWTSLPRMARFLGCTPPLRLLLIRGRAVGNHAVGTPGLRLRPGDCHAAQKEARAFQESELSHGRDSSPALRDSQSMVRKASGRKVHRSALPRTLAYAPDEALRMFEQTVAGSKWKKLRGWHVLRHSFASICAMKGVRESTIDSWMGHQTETMRHRYRHLFPDVRKAEMGRVFSP